MTKLKILILEDNAIQSQVLALMLQQIGYEVAGVASSGEKAIQMFVEHQPDLVILDIKVNGALDGIEVGEVMMGIRKTPLIYLTAFAEYYERSKITYPAAFFEKPYNEKDVARAIELAIRNYASKEVADSPNVLEKRIIFPNYIPSSDRHWLRLRAGESFIPIKTEDILFIKSDNVYLEIYTTIKPQPFVLTLGLTEFQEANAQINKHLMKCHRSYIINIHKVIRFSPSRPHPYLTLDQYSDPIPVSEAHYTAIKSTLMDQ